MFHSQVSPTVACLREVSESKIIIYNLICEVSQPGSLAVRRRFQFEIQTHHQREEMKRRDSLRHLHGTGRVSAMRSKFPHPRSDKRAHIWDVVRNVTTVSRKKRDKQKDIPPALPNMTKSPSLEIFRRRKRSTSRDRAMSGSSDEGFLAPPKSPPRSPPRRRGSVLKLMLKSHVKQALSRRSIVTSLRQDDEDEYRRRQSVADLDARKVVKSVLTSSPTSKSFRSNSLDDLHKRYVLSVDYILFQHIHKHTQNIQRTCQFCTEKRRIFEILS